MKTCPKGTRQHEPPQGIGSTETKVGNVQEVFIVDPHDEGSVANEFSQTQMWKDNGQAEQQMNSLREELQQLDQTLLNAGGLGMGEWDELEAKAAERKTLKMRESRGFGPGGMDEAENMVDADCLIEMDDCEIDADVASALKRLVQAEVDGAISKLEEVVGKTRQGGAYGEHSCCFCPFRQLPRRCRLLDHMKRYHTPDRLFTACTRSDAQWHIVVAIYNQSCALEVLPSTGVRSNMLATSAKMLRQWIQVDDESLVYMRNQNDFDVSLRLSDAGPSYVHGSQTQGLYRSNHQLYYDQKAGNLLLSLVLKNRGKAQSVYMDLVRHYTTMGSPCAWLLPVNGIQDLIDDVMQKTEVKNLIANLIDQATSKGEWEVLSHDATFKILFSIIGQTKMAQVPGESHACHTFIGKTGACPGMAFEYSEGLPCFKSASCKVLPIAARQTVKAIFSDSPASLENSTDIYPNLLGVAEDGIHFVLRIEGCYGEHRCSLSRRVLLLQSKFRMTLRGSVYHGAAKVHGPEGVWDLHAPRPETVGRDWDIYVREPYRSHQQYINDIMDVVAEFQSEMERTSKGRPLLDILQSGAEYKHFGYLQNAGVLLGTLRPETCGLLAWGTTANEALHNQLKMCMHTVTQQHECRLETKANAFCLNHMLAHNSAAYTPTTVQRTQLSLLSLIQGSIGKHFFPATDVVAKTIASRTTARQPAVPRDQEKTTKSKQQSKINQAQWKKQAAMNVVKKNKRQQAHPVHVKLRVKRTVFTKKKEQPLRRKPTAAKKKKQALRRKPAAATVLPPRRRLREKTTVNCA